MKYEVVKAEGYDYLKVELGIGERIYAQPQAYLYHVGELEINTKSFGGFKEGLKKMLLGGESYFINEYRANSNVEVSFAPSLPGQIISLDLRENGYVISDGAYLASDESAEITTKFMGLKGMFTSGGMYWLHAKGSGNVWINTYGSVIEVELRGNSIYVDNFNLLAYEDTINMEVKKFGGLKTLFFGGEGFVLKLEGYGKVYIQTRSFGSLINLISKNLPSSD